MKLNELFLQLGDWKAVREKVISENILQNRTLKTLKRLCSEIISRLKTLSRDELRLLREADRQEQGYLLWIAICRRYMFVRDFAVEVLRERHLNLKEDLTYEDFDSFFNRKSEWHAELDQIQQRTKIKVRQVLFRMLRDANLLTTGNKINPPILSPRLLEVISKKGTQGISYLPIFESDL